MIQINAGFIEQYQCQKAHLAIVLTYNKQYERISENQAVNHKAVHDLDRMSGATVQCLAASRHSCVFQRPQFVPAGRNLLHWRDQTGCCNRLRNAAGDGCITAASQSLPVLRCQFRSAGFAAASGDAVACHCRARSVSGISLPFALAMVHMAESPSPRPACFVLSRALLHRFRLKPESIFTASAPQTA